MPSVTEWPLREQRRWVNNQLRTFLLWQRQRPGSAHRTPCCLFGKTPLTSKVWSLEGEGGYISLKSLGPVTRLLKCLDIAGWEMHEGYLVADITKLNEFILYPTRAHQWSVPFRVTVANNTRLGGGLGKALWKHTGSSCFYLHEMSLYICKPDHCLVPLLSEDRGSTS